MASAGITLWRLGTTDEHNLGVCCTEDGLFLGRTPLVERRAGWYAVRPPADLRRLLGRAYRGSVDVDRLLPGLGVVEKALDERNLCLAQIAALQLRLPELPNRAMRGDLETEDLLIKSAYGEILARGGWDPDKHPRAGGPPNPGWFAPTGQSSPDQPAEIAQGTEDERAPEEALDPLAEIRQRQWDAALARLREIDPQNPNLTYVASPGSPPAQEALDRLNATVEAAAIERVVHKLMPGGVPIGKSGNDPSVRELAGGRRAAEDLFDYLRVGGTVRLKNEKITVVQLPSGAGYVTFRPVSNSGPPAVDLNVPGVIFDKIHFP